MKLNNKGFSLVEIMLAVVVSTLVLGAITAMIGFAARSSRETNERVELQNQVKDAVNHIESYTMEAETATWQKVGSANVLVVFQRRDDAKNIVSPVTDSAVQADQVETLDSNVYAYWMFDDGDSSKGKNLYFGKCSRSGDVKLSDLKPDNSEANINNNRVYLLADNVTDFDCRINKNSISGKYTVDVELKAKRNKIEYSSNKTVYLRNQ